MSNGTGTSSGRSRYRYTTAPGAQHHRLVDHRAVGVHDLPGTHPGRGGRPEPGAQLGQHRSTE